MLLRSAMLLVLYFLGLCHGFGPQPERKTMIFMDPKSFLLVSSTNRVTMETNMEGAPYPTQGHASTRPRTIF